MLREATFCFLEVSNILRFRDFLRDVYQQSWPDSPDELLTLLQNMNLPTDDGMLNLAGVLLFAERPEWTKPRFIVKAIRNPILVSYIAKGLLPYRGLGSGIKRALENWPEIDFTDDRDGCLFTATVHRKEIAGSMEPEIGSEKSAEESISSQKSSRKILELMRDDPMVTIADLAQSVGITDRAIKKQIEKLKAQGRIRRIGPDRGGHWEVVE